MTDAKRLAIWLYPYQVEWAKKRAEEEGLPVSHFIRNMIRRAVENLPLQGG